MTDYLKRRLQQTGIILAAIPAIGWLPLGLSQVFAAVWQLLFGFDDFPLVIGLVGIVIGLGLALFTLFHITCGLWRGEILSPAKITFMTAIFSLLSVPVSSVIINIVEH
jgi:hypothetical protein